MSWPCLQEGFGVTPQWKTDQSSLSHQFFGIKGPANNNFAHQIPEAYQYICLHPIDSQPHHPDLWDWRLILLAVDLPFGLTDTHGMCTLPSWETMLVQGFAIPSWLRNTRRSVISSHRHSPLPLAKLPNLSLPHCHLYFGYQWALVPPLNTKPTFDTWSCPKICVLGFCCFFILPVCVTLGS